MQSKIHIVKKTKTRFQSIFIFFYEMSESADIGTLLAWSEAKGARNKRSFHSLQLLSATHSTFCTSYCRKHCWVRLSLI